jgi:DNA-binding MarR family transcriptional regulator
MVGAESGKHVAGANPAQSVETALGIVEGDVLLYLDRYGATPMRRVIRELGWPSPMVTMAIGALIREGLIGAKQHELELVLEPLRPKTQDALLAGADVAREVAACQENLKGE